MPNKPRTRREIVDAMQEAARIGGASLAENFARLSALPILENYLRPEDMPGARQVLKAAAFTYVAAALVSILNIARWLRILRF